MTLKATFEEAARQALKNQEPLLVSTLRLALAAIHNREIEKKAKTGEGQLSEEEVLAVVRSEVKKRRAAIAEYEKAGRKELAGKEALELGILEKYLPAEMPDVELEAVLKGVITDLGVASQKDIGRVMGEAMKRLGGRVSGERVSAAAKRLLRPAA